LKIIQFLVHSCTDALVFSVNYDLAFSFGFYLKSSPYLFATQPLQLQNPISF
jgi:hypothetical protein